MELDKVLDTVDEYLQEVNVDTKERIDRIKSIQDFLSYNLRLTELSDEEKLDFVNCMEGYPLSDSQRSVIDGCKNDEQKEHYFSMWARSTYFRRCAWLSYLYGEEHSSKPTVSNVHMLSSVA